MTDDTRAWPPSLWAETAGQEQDCAPLAGDSHTEIAIVGGGFTGLSAALHLAQAGHGVRVLEAVQPGWGASGRNGGQVNPGWKLLPEEVETLYGQSRRGINFLEKWVRQWSARGATVELLSRRETVELLGTEVYLGALLDRRGGHIQPLSYARGLARAAMGAGALVHGDSPVLSLGAADGGWKLATPNGSLAAEQVLICTNGYTGDLWPGLATSFVAATETLDEQRLAAILPGRHAVSETRRVQVYYRLDAGGRFVIGARGHWFNTAQAGDVAHVHAEACRLFPALAHVKWQFHWGGYTAMTLSHTPKLMKLAPGLHAAMGYNGRGVAMATMMGKQMALAVTGGQPEMSVEPMSRIPLHGLRQVGLSFRLLAGTLLDRCEHLAERRGGMRLLGDD